MGTQRSLSRVLLYFWSQGGLKDLLYANVVWPFRHYSALNTVPYAQGILRDHWYPWVIPTNGIHWTAGMAAIQITPFPFVAALPVLLLILGFKNRAANIQPEILLYWLCGWALWLSEFHKRDMVHLAFGSPLLVILCIHYLSEYRAKVIDLALQILLISASYLACINLFMVLAAHPVKTRVGTVAVYSDASVLTFLDKKVAPGTEIFAYPYCPMYYFLTATNNPTRYSVLVYRYNTSSQYQEVVQTLDQRKVKYAVWDTNYITKPAPTQSFIIEPYLDSHYKIIWAKEGIRIMERKSDGDTK